ncbi:MAG: CerR family C-terminal domain-containing protein [Planctomycetota bacterium]
MRSSDTDVRQRLLSSAERLFAERGPDRVSVRDIAEHAGVSHGSIRYHFGSKEALYRACSSVDQVDFDPDDLEGMTRAQAEAKLRSFVHAVVAYKAKVGADAATAMALLAAEVSRDGGPDPEYYDKVLAPGHEYVKALILTMHPRIVDERKLEILAFNLIFQCVMIRTARGIVLRRLNLDTLESDDVELIAETILETTLGGLEAVGG